MAIPDVDVRHVAESLLRDVNSTVGRAAEVDVLGRALSLGRRHHERAPYVESLVGDVQQELHDCFIDTVWPQCPRHRNHPLWFHDDGWWCDADRLLVARLGELDQATAAG